MSIVKKYGMAVDFLAITGDLLVAIEVTRQVVQRPTFVSASWRVAGAASAAQIDGASRLLVYKGNIGNETDPGWNMTVIKPWDSVDSNVNVFVDTLVPYRKPIDLDLTKIPDEFLPNPGQGLGALLLMPVDSANTLITNAQLILTFLGQDAVATGTQGYKAV